MTALRMLATVAPAGVSVCEAFADPPAAVLLPAERSKVADAVAKRRLEYATGRWCARTALADLGVPAVAVRSGDHGEPCWPAGVVGSITHCDGYRAAAVAHRSDLHGIGIDAEPHDRLPDGVLALVAGPAERDRLAALGRVDPAWHWDRLLFSAKESVYKAWFPLARRWLDFSDADLTVEPGPDSGSGIFTARLTVAGPLVGGTELTVLSGRWLIRGGLVVTAVTVPAR
ncbi:4'-phosphopantetheinyl transferase superfamily protein [Asanoa sp. NPDC050611]|uniref:4'-phosphopantetheinyl transferase family protein n=1 Tax=Asanoa sp. NPDC050611 TaxID=3157098 RepID=UPI0033DB436D